MSSRIQALKPSIGMLKFLGIGLGIYAILFILAVVAHTLFGIEYWTLEYKTSRLWSEITGWTCALRAPEFLGGGCIIPVPIVVWHTEVTVESFQVDVVTYLFVGAALLLFFVIEQLVMIIVLIIYWIFNSFIVGRDPETGAVVVPFALFQLIGLIPIIGDVFKNIPAFPETSLVSLASGISTLRSFVETIITGGFALGSQSLIDFINKTVLGRGS